jgi:hypothetical protein
MAESDLPVILEMFDMNPGSSRPLYLKTKISDIQFVFWISVVPPLHELLFGYWTVLVHK